MSPTRSVSLSRGCRSGKVESSPFATASTTVCRAHSKRSATSSTSHVSEFVSLRSSLSVVCVTHLSEYEKQIWFNPPHPSYEKRPVKRRVSFFPPLRAKLFPPSRLRRTPPNDRCAPWGEKQGVGASKTRKCLADGNTHQFHVCNPDISLLQADIDRLDGVQHGGLLIGDNAQSFSEFGFEAFEIALSPNNPGTSI